ncbi:MAG: hypothetical protein DYG83_10565 [Candidatus Brocadia sp. AMX2]|nr:MULTISPECIES: hypothetical protein [Brocadia]MBC6933013.1 hypothetical protein [Candidatus Brocadia sp.]MBL1169319.1 hypothetical protein [Candidatus Brocadia sp. AMX1]MCK6469859.1 hypothetical protein [Candidatus Brocadia sinica]NOG41821.1 hypothetical protein [Planctomycetota bacterium]KAA0241957.1 MAG: hypothetical protein EDM70_16510 [Candidatus Brocadia sp. AMX2]
MKHLVMIVTTLVLSGICCVETYADVSYADLFLTGRGYKPVEDIWTKKPLTAHSPDGSCIPDNLFYKEWCINTFKNGEQIYEAYREIAFDIDYRAEPPKTDYWQTPGETRQSKKGDCEDSVFLFFSNLSGLDINGDLVWGWVTDKDTSIAFAHVWYQLFDKHGRAYIVEGFSKEWNGIIPLETITRVEERVPTLMLRHDQVNYLIEKATPISDHGWGRKFAESFEDGQFSWDIFLNNTSFVKEIFRKLHDMIIRYKG